MAIVRYSTNTVATMSVQEEHEYIEVALGSSVNIEKRDGVATIVKCKTFICKV